MQCRISSIKKSIKEKFKKNWVKGFSVSEIILIPHTISFCNPCSIWSAFTLIAIYNLSSLKLLSTNLEIISVVVCAKLKYSTTWIFIKMIMAISWVTVTQKMYYLFKGNYPSLWFSIKYNIKVVGLTGGGAKIQVE